MHRLLILTLVAVGCAGPADDPPDWDVAPPFAGFALSPPSLDQEGFTEFFSKAAEGADLVAWVGAWQSIDDATVVYEMAAEHGYVPVVVTGFPTGPDGLREVPDDPAELIDTVSDWVEEHPIPYLGFGVELNAFLFERSPEDFEWFVDTFPKIVAAVHEVSPETVVFPGFQLERLRGLKGGLFGEEDTDPVWDLIDRFPDADAIGFTSYPGLIFAEPAEMPDDYYTEILTHTGKPIVFTELGWQAGGELLEWSGTPEKQSEFVTNQVTQLAGIADMIIWSFMYDQQVGGAPFETMGLIQRDGTQRPAWREWLELRDRSAAVQRSQRNRPPLDPAIPEAGSAVHSPVTVFPSSESVRVPNLFVPSAQVPSYSPSPTSIRTISPGSGPNVEE